MNIIFIPVKTFKQGKLKFCKSMPLKTLIHLANPNFAWAKVAEGLD